MSLLINGVDMPKSKPICIVIDVAGQARQYDLNNEKFIDDELYEAISVPPHGRLGDLDALHKLFLEKAKEYKGVGGAMVAMAALCIANAPNIIPAEEGEK